MDKQKIKELIPLGLVICALLYTAFAVLTSDSVFTTSHWIACASTSVVVATYFINKKLSTILLGLTLTLGVFHVLSFTPYFVAIGGGLTFSGDSEFMIEFQMYPFLILLTFIYAHYKGFMTWINKDGL